LQLYDDKTKYEVILRILFHSKILSFSSKKTFQNGGEDKKSSRHFFLSLITEGKKLIGNDKIYTYGQIIRKVKKEAKNYLKNNL
jgi:hypothetical protein